MSTSISPDTRPGAVHLTVASLRVSVPYYERALGLRVHAREGAVVRLGAGGEDLLVLEEEPGAQPADGFSGLFHFALLLPTRADLARWLAHVARERVPLTGASDHAVSEAVYLRDPDHHGIEVYADRPREQWEGQVAETMTTLPLDTDDLLLSLGEDPLHARFDGLAAGTTMGHVHLRVADIPRTTTFYRDTLGLDVTAELPGSATFLSAGGYHHHVGANTWESAGAPAAPPGTARLVHATLLLPTTAERDAVAARVERDTGQAVEPVDGAIAVRDPSGNVLHLRAQR